MRTKVYNLDYLINEELTDDDLNILCNTDSLLISLIVGMYRFMGSTKENDLINVSIKKDISWLNDYQWTEAKRAQFEHKIKKIYKNIYRYNDTVCLQKAQWFTSIYGFSLKTAFKKHKH